MTSGSLIEMYELSGVSNLKPAKAVCRRGNLDINCLCSLSRG